MIIELSSLAFYGHQWGWYGVHGYKRFRGLTRMCGACIDLVPQSYICRYIVTLDPVHLTGKQYG